MCVICIQVKKFTEHNLKHIGKALQVYLTNKTVLAEQKRDMWLTDLGWVNSKLCSKLPWNVKLSQPFIFYGVVKKKHHEVLNTGSLVFKGTPERKQWMSRDGTA